MCVYIYIYIYMLLKKPQRKKLVGMYCECACVYIYIYMYIYAIAKTIAEQSTKPSSDNDSVLVSSVHQEYPTISPDFIG